ncbi:unnamed protein product, partial [Pocillopora meandrina]
SVALIRSIPSLTSNSASRPRISYNVCVDAITEKGIQPVANSQIKRDIGVIRVKFQQNVIYQTGVLIDRDSLLTGW